jgi:hypothetical protein
MLLPAQGAGQACSKPYQVGVPAVRHQHPLAAQAVQGPRHGYLSIQTDYSNRQCACLRERSDPTTLLPAGLLLAPFRARLQHACPLPAGVQLQLQCPGVPCTLSTTLLSTHLSHTRTWFSVSEQHDVSSGPLALIT